MLTFALALRHPELVAIAHPISGYLPRALWPRAPAAGARVAPIRAAHGTADDIVPFAPTHRMVRALSARGFDVTLRSFEGVAHTQSREMAAMMGEVIGRGIHRAETGEAN
jgi:phospholipase/carboxylesterase